MVSGDATKQIAFGLERNQIAFAQNRELGQIVTRLNAFWVNIRQRRLPMTGMGFGVAQLLAQFRHQARLAEQRILHFSFVKHGG